MDYKLYTSAYLYELQQELEQKLRYTLIVINGLGCELIEPPIPRNYTTEIRSMNGNEYETHHLAWLSPREVEYLVKRLIGEYANITVVAYEVVESMKNPTSN